MRKNLTPLQKQRNKERRAAIRKKAKIKARLDEQKNQKPVSSITITVTWNKSRTWGYCPRAEARVTFRDGTYEMRDHYMASGWGYDKASTVVASIFNDFLQYKLWRMSKAKIRGGHGSMDEKNGPAPYGINCYDSGRGFSGGIGMSCYPRIAEFLGGKLETISTGKTFDVYRYTNARG